MTSHAIHYRRPETPWSLSRITTQSAMQAVQQVERLIALGYKVTDVTPPLSETVADGPRRP
jgi:hypothetical protein